MIRIENSKPGILFCGGQLYNVFLTAHALIMIFFIVIPGLIGGFGNFLIPLMIDFFDLFLPRVNFFSFWVLPVSFFFILTSLGVGFGSGTGWTLYPPLSVFGQTGISTDIVLFGLHVAGVRSISSSINFLCTVKDCRAQGKTFSVLLLFVWCIVVTVFLLLLSLPVLAIAITMLITDRNLNSSFFESKKGGNIIIFQHLFWFFGHPEVYVLIAPAFGLVSLSSQILSSLKVVFSLKGIRGAIKSIGFVGCLVWAHHIFTVGIDQDSRGYFRVATIVIAVPTGIKVFSWLITLFFSGYGFGCVAMD